MQIDQENKKTSKNKIYHLHEPDVACISKGNACQRYKFGTVCPLNLLPKISEAKRTNQFDEAISVFSAKICIYR